MRGLLANSRGLALVLGVLFTAGAERAASALTLPDTGNCNAGGSTSCLTINQNQQTNAGTGLTVNSGGVSIATSTAFGNAITATVSGTVVPSGYSAIYGTVGSQYNRGVEGYNSGGGSGVWGHAAGSGTGVSGSSASGYGVSGYSTSGNGLYGSSSTGVGILGSSTYSAMEGSTTGGAGLWMSGVYGHNNSTTNDGIGVAGRVYRSSSYAVFGDNTAGGWAGYFQGNVYVSGTLTQMSDARSKKDVADLRYGLAETLKLRPVTYQWRSDKASAGTQLGLIAQEAQQIVPEVVIANEGSGMLSINYTALVPVVIKAVQEQQKIIERQEARLAALEHARGPVASSVIPGGLGAGLAFGLLPLGLVAGLRRRSGRSTKN